METNVKKSKYNATKTEDQIADSLNYPPDQDIYNKGQKESEIDPEDISKTKTFEKTSKNNEKSFEEDVSGSDLDVPGSEADNWQVDISNEDEENEYYSIGGDNHNDLEEDNG